MSKRFIFAAIFAGVLAVGAFAQAFTVSYLDGTVEQQTAKGWKAIAIGDQVPTDATVRISQAGSLEMLRAKMKITLLKDGVYQMAGLSDAAGAVAGSLRLGPGGSSQQKSQHGQCKYRQPFHTSLHHW